MLIDIRLVMLILVCFSSGAMLLGFAITRMYYGAIAKDAERTIKQNNTMWNELLHENNEGWFEFYNDLIEGDKNDVDVDKRT